MTGDFRERLQDLAGEMSTLHAPRNLEARVHRRQVGLIAGGVVSVLAFVLIAVAGVHALNRPEPVEPAVPTRPNGFPFPIEGNPVKATKALLQAPEDLMVDPNGNLYISEYYGNKVDVLASDGRLATIAGTGQPGHSGNNGAATSATIDSPAGMALDGDGNLLFVDNGNSCIRQIDPQGIITTVAGICGVEGYSGDGGSATEAKLSRPLGLVIDPNGGYYFSDNDFGLVRHVDANGKISTFAGAGSVSPFHIGPGGVQASDLHLARTSYIVRDPRTGDLYVSDLRLNIVVKIDASGMATLFAGTGKRGYTGDGGPATQAELNFPSGLAMDDHGDLFVTDGGNKVVREIRTDGIIRTVAGSGVVGNSGDGGKATKANLDAPSGLAFADGMLYIADQQNDLVRRVDPSGRITTVAGVYK